jgi:hypothetical protein
MRERMCRANAEWSTDAIADPNGFTRGRIRPKLASITSIPFPVRGDFAGGKSGLRDRHTIPG